RSPTLQRCSISPGSQLFSRSLKPGIISDEGSFSSSRSTHASSTGKLAQIFGPRSAKTFLISTLYSRREECSEYADLLQVSVFLTSRVTRSSSHLLPDNSCCRPS